jgi:hypothetical protein
MSYARTLCRFAAVLASIPALPLPSAAEDAAVAADTPADKSGYHLFRPVPRELLRAMNTDRPDAPESPYTVDAGHFQVEMSLLGFTRDRYNSESRTRQVLAAAPLLLKAGVLDDLDLELGLEPYTQVEVKDRNTGEDETISGFGDTILRAKWNLWGNDEGKTACALLPFVKFPTAHHDLGNGEFEGGLATPLDIELPGDFLLGLMPEIDVARNPDDDRYYADFYHAASLAHDLVGGLGASIGLAGFVDLSGEQPYRAYFDVDLTFAVTSDLQLDCGVMVGLTKAADDIGLFLGISVRA